MYAKSENNMRPEQVFLFGLVSIFLGIGCRILIPFPIILLIGFLFCVSLAFFKKEKWILLIFLLFVLGFTRAGVTMQNKIIYSNQELNIIGKITEDPVVLGTYGSVKIKTEEIGGKKIKNTILIYFNNPKDYSRNDLVEFKGILSKPDNYYQNQGIGAIVRANDLRIIKSSISSVFTKQKNRIRGIVEEKMAIPYSSILSAMILGDNYGLPNDLKESLNESGLRHIISISGTHITIIMNLLMSFLIFFGISRKKSGIATLVIIFLYVLFVGFYAPAIRAAIMGASMILAQIFGRFPDSFRFLLFAGVIILLLNPYLFFDPGFWLSFTATCGMIFFSNSFTGKIERILKNREISQILGITFAAQIFSLPVLMYYFGSTSIFAFLSNLLIAPVIPFVISFGFIAIILGLIFSPLGTIFFVIIQILLSYLIFISNIFAKISIFRINFFPNIFIVLSAYILLIIWARHTREEEKVSFLMPKLD